MADSSSAPSDAGEDRDAETASDADGAADEADDMAALRRDVEERYDFENFGPADMAEMTAEEWDAAFDPDTWITGTDLLDRVEDDLKRRVAERDVFAVVERVDDAEGERLVAYSDEGYAIVYPDGSVEGSGTVLRDVKPTVALCSMDDYEVKAPPEDASLPSPEQVVEGSGEFGNLMLQVVAGMQILAGLGLLVAYAATDLSTIVAPTAALGFIFIGVLLFVVVANARLSDKFRAEEFRHRLRAAGVESGERPPFLPDADDSASATTPADGDGLADGRDADNA